MDDEQKAKYWVLAFAMLVGGLGVLNQWQSLKHGDIGAGELCFVLLIAAIPVARKLGASWQWIAMAAIIATITCLVLGFVLLSTARWQS